MIPVTSKEPITMADGKPTVFVVDDDVSVRQSLELLLASAGWEAQTFACAQDFIARRRDAAPGCVVLDVNLPDLDGLKLQTWIADEQPGMPIIFITGCGDVPMTVRAMKGGALDVLTKPFADDTLLSAIENAIDKSDAALRDAAELRVLRERHASLTPREREVMALVVTGRLNKQVGGDLSISEITVKAHSCKMMQKMKARSLPDLVNMAAKLG
jgi:FixJ family two-component response regulator